MRHRLFRQQIAHSLQRRFRILPRFLSFSEVGQIIHGNTNRDINSDPTPDSSGIHTMNHGNANGFLDGALPPGTTDPEWQLRSGELNQRDRRNVVPFCGASRHHWHGTDIYFYPADPAALTTA